MHIIAGKYKGLSLTYPPKSQFRPTQARVKEAIMNILTPYLKKATILDLCCGTAGLGLEALSQGAHHLTCVDQDIRHAKENIQKILTKYPEEKPRITLIQSKIQSYLKRNTKQFDIVLFDPPWNEQILYECVSKFDILSPNGRWIYEHRKSSQLPLAPYLESDTVHTYGDTQITILKKVKSHDKKSHLSGEL